MCMTIKSHREIYVKKYVKAIRKLFFTVCKVGLTRHHVAYEEILSGNLAFPADGRGQG